MVANWVVVGLLLRISDQVRRPLPALQPLSSEDDTQVVRMR
jgi:hypothetical protein